MKSTIAAVPLIACLGVAASAADFDAGAAHNAFMDAFNNRQWDDVKSIFTEDSVFHRASGDTAFMGPDAIVERFSSEIGADEKWNVKFTHLDSTDQLVGKDGRVVERGLFAVTAGEGDAACYAGSYMMTWAPKDDAWGLQHFAWQDVEADPATCQ